MSNGYIESSLKRFLKRKVKVTLGLVVAFMITGTVGFAAAEGTTEWHIEQAVESLKGMGKNTDKILKPNGNFSTVYTQDNGNLVITIDKLYGNGQEKAETTISAKSVSTQTLKNLNPAIKMVDNLHNGLKIEKLQAGENENSEIINGFNAGLDLKNNVEGSVADGEGQISVIEGKIDWNNIISIQQTAQNGGIAVNKGIINMLQSIGKDSKGYNYGIIESSGKNGQSINGDNAIAYNYGIIANTGNGGQRINKGEKSTVYNYGIIANRDSHGQEAVGQYGKLYNYGMIMSKSYSGQITTGAHSEAWNYGVIANQAYDGQTATGNNSKLYNYGLIENTGTHGQTIKGGENIEVYNYGVINNGGSDGQSINKTTNSTAYNYGIISNKSNNGQSVTINGTENKIYNYGLIRNTGKYGQKIAGKGNEGYNFGIINNGGDWAISATTNAKGYNYGVVKSSNKINIFEGDVENRGLVIATENKDISDLQLGTNKGVVIYKDTQTDTYKLADGQENITVQPLTSGKLNSNTLTQDTAFIQNQNMTIEKNTTLENKVITAVVNKESNGAVFTVEEGEGTLTLKDTNIIGYFEQNGTLLDASNSDLYLSGKTYITAVRDGEEGKDVQDINDVVAVNIGEGKTLTINGEAEIIGKIQGTQGTLILESAHSDNLAADIKVLNFLNKDGYTDVTLNIGNYDTVTLNLTGTTPDETNKIVFGDNVKITGDIKDVGTSAGNETDITFTNISNIGGNITLGAGEDTVSINENKEYKNIVDLGAGTDTLKISKDSEDESVFNYNVMNAETIELGNGKWHIGENAGIGFGNKDVLSTGDTTLKVDGAIHVDLINKNGQIGTTLDGVIKDGTNLTIDAANSKETGVRYVVGEGVDITKDSYVVNGKYELAQDTKLGGASIFDVKKDGDKIIINVKSSEEIMGKSGYESLYRVLLANLSENNELREDVNSTDAANIAKYIKGINNTAEAYYTAGYAVTKNITDSFMSVAEDFSKKAGKGEWLAQGKYINSDTEFDGGNKVKGYDGDINSAVGMIEYGVSDTTSYGAVFGGGETTVDIDGGGQLDGDNYYVGAFVKHRTASGIDLVGNIGYTISELDSELKNNFTANGKSYSDLVNGTADSNAISFGLKGKKDIYVADDLRLEPSLGAKLMLIHQDAVTGKDMNFRIDEQDVNVFEGNAGINLVKEFALDNGQFELSTGLEYAFFSTNRDEDARYTLYDKDLELVKETDIADNKGTFHVGADYEHENGVGFNAKYEMMWSDEGDDSRITAGIFYRF